MTLRLNIKTIKSNKMIIKSDETTNRSISTPHKLRSNVLHNVLNTA